MITSYNSIFNKNEEDVTNSDNLIIIDASWILFVATHGNKVIGEDGQEVLNEKGNYTYEEKSFEDIKYHIDNIMIDLFNTLGASKYIGYLDCNFDKNFRLKYYPEYKANRKGKEKPKFFKEAKEYLVEQWGLICVNGIEADDAVNITRLNYKDSITVCVDKDLLNLTGTLMYNAKTNAFVNTDLNQAEYSFWFDMITGQSGDNIKGIPGKGKKFAEKLLTGKDINLMPGLVLGEYVQNFGIKLGLDEFYKNYKCLKILELLSEVPEESNFKFIPEPNLVPNGQ